MACPTEPSEFLQPIEYHGQPSLQKCALDLSDVPIEDQQRKPAASKGSREKCNGGRVMLGAETISRAQRGPRLGHDLHQPHGTFSRSRPHFASFLDTTGGLRVRGALNGKVGAAFTSTASQHGGQETTLFSIITNLLHLGTVIVGLDYGYQGQMGVDFVRGGSPYGATTVAAGDGSRQPTDQELQGARYQGKRVAETAAKLAA
jgi:hypothetical protein